MNNKNWIDVSATISDSMVHWPTDPATRIYKAEHIGHDGAIANVTAIQASAHLGTHIDAPLHFFEGGADVASIDINILTGDAKVFHINNNKAITYDEIKQFDIEEGDRVLFRTHNSDVEWERLPFKEDYIYLATDAAKYLVDKNVRCIGIDYLSIGGKDNNPDVHRLLLGKAIIIIEGLKLGKVGEGSYEMICLPLKIEKSDGGPARVILRKTD